MPGKACQARKQAKKEQRKRDLATALGVDASELENQFKVQKPDGTTRIDIQKLEEEYGITSWVEVPPLASLTGQDKVKATKLCRALFEAVTRCGPEGGSERELASDWEVLQLRKDPCFDRQRLGDILGRHPDVFLVVTDEEKKGGHFRAYLQPKAGAKCPGKASNTVIGLVGETVPDAVEEGTTKEDKFQALRIHAIRALYKRGGKAVLHELGQDPYIVELRKSTLSGTRSLLNFVQAFPSNFNVEDQGSGSYLISILSMDVISDPDALQAAIQTINALPKKDGPAGAGPRPKGAAVKGSGKGKGGKSWDAGQQNAAWEACQQMMKGMMQMMKGGGWGSGGCGKGSGKGKGW